MLRVVITSYFKEGFQSNIALASVETIILSVSALPVCILINYLLYLIHGMYVCAARIHLHSRTFA